MFFESWAGLGRVLAVGTLAYLGLILILRVSGKRTLSKLNAFDLVVIVALGSTLATVLLSKSVVLAEGLLALALLVLLQFVVAWLTTRSPRFRSLINAEPTMLAHEGRFLDGPLRRERITREEVLAAVRSQGLGSIEQTLAVVLETDGSLSVLKSGSGRAVALAGVRRPDEVGADAGTRGAP